MVVPSGTGGRNHLGGSGGGYPRDMVLGPLRNCNPRTNAIRVLAVQMVHVNNILLVEESATSASGVTTIEMQLNSLAFCVLFECVLAVQE